MTWTLETCRVTGRASQTVFSSSPFVPDNLFSGFLLYSLFYILLRPHHGLLYPLAVITWTATVNHPDDRILPSTSDAEKLQTPKVSGRQPPK